MGEAGEEVGAVVLVGPAMGGQDMFFECLGGGEHSLAAAIVGIVGGGLVLLSQPEGGGLLHD